MKQLFNKKIKCYFRSEKKIEFHDVNDFNQILLTYSVAPHKPGAVRSYAIYLTVRGYSISKSPRDIHWLDVSESKPAARKRVIHTKQKLIYDMCCLQDGGEQLLVLAAGNRLFAINTNVGVSRGYTDHHQGRGHP